MKRFFALAAAAASLLGTASFAQAAIWPDPVDPWTRQPLLQQGDDTAQAAPIPREVVEFEGRHAPGTIVVSTSERRLYYVLGGGQAIRYGIGVGRPGFEWAGVKTVTAKQEWPAWTPPAEMLKRRPDLPRHMRAGSRTRSERARSTSAARSTGFTARTSPIQSVMPSHPAAFAC
jgi:lipoprotein-anchoring transpeptidase ErfK/SrfK